MDEIIDINTLFGPMPLASADLTVDSLLALMQTHRVRAACTLSTLGLLLDPTIGNAATRAACTEHPELLPVATLNPTMFYGDAAPIQRLKEDGFRMVKFFPAQQGYPVEFAPFRALLDALAPANLPLVVEVGRPGDVTALLKALETYPAPVVLSNVSAALLAETVAALRARSNWYVETSHLLGLGCLKMVVETLGAQRTLFGTAAPMQPIAGMLQVVALSGLDADARQQLLSGNARRLLGL